MIRYFSIFLLVSIFIQGSSSAQVTADFTFSASEGCGSLQVSFCDNSISMMGTITTLTWDLGGVPSSLECPARVFSSPGTYTICLTAEDDLGNIDQLCRTDLIVIHRLPTADFIANSNTACVNDNINFTDASIAADVPITNWDWDLVFCGIINNTSNAPVACTYNTAGIYSASLTITDQNGCTATSSQSNAIEIFDKPIVQFSADNVFQCDPPFIVNFTNDNISPNTNYLWTFGNGSTFNGNSPGPISYNDYGEFSVSLVATNTLTGCVDSLRMDDLISVGFPIEFTISQQMICLGESVEFNDISPNNSPDIRLWDFGDGNTSSNQVENHVYAAPGCYTATLSITEAGCTQSKLSTFCVQVFPLPTVSINNDNAIGCTLPHPVNFIPVAPTAQSWEWDFGDGSPISNDQNPTHLYNAFGDFQVSLTVTDLNGCTNTFNNNTISIHELEAGLSIPYFEGCAPLNFSVSENANSISPTINWSWQISTNMGVYTSSDSTAMFSIPDTGIWDITLVVTNDLGCMDSRTFENALSVGQIPVVDFQANPLVECIESDIRFMDLSSSYVEEWLWEFGDGEDTTLQNPSHQFQDTGFYDITLTVGHNGCYNSLTIPDYIQILEPLAKFDIDFDCEQPFRRIFVDRSIGAEVVHWDFGVAGVDTDTSNVFNPVFDFPGPGIYTISMTVFNASTNCSHTQTEEIEITLPAAQFIVNQTQGCVPLTIQVSESSNFANAWTWIAPGGVISNPNAPQPSITYNVAGGYTDITLIVEDINACTDTFVFVDTIFVNDVEVNFTINPQNGCRPLSVDFADNSTSIFGTNVQWDWTFGNVLGTASGINSTFVFDTVGTFPVSLRVRDDWGCFSTQNIPDAVQVTQPVAAFSTEDTLSCTSHCVQFDNQSAGLNLTYFWEFGDGGTSNNSNPLHCYSTEGIYTVCLTVVDAFGCDSTLCVPNYIEISDPVADFVPSQTLGTCPPFEVTFQNNSQNANSYEWDFGDGSDSSNLVNPVYTYLVPGIFDIQLIAESTPFCKDTLLIPNLIELLGPVGEFFYTVDSSCAPTEVTFYGSSLDNFQYIWDFGNGDQETLLSFQNRDTVRYIYMEEGDYFPTLTLIDPSGCSRTFDAPMPLHISTIHIDFFSIDTLQCGKNEEVTFFNLSSSPDGINTFQWQFPGANPSSSTDGEPMVTFPGDGTYPVWLIAENDFCIDTLIRNEYVKIGPIPEAVFEMDVTDGCNPLTVHFTDNSTVSNSIIDSWEWDFGDGTSSSDQNPSHLFDTAGVLQITLTASSEIGCRDDTIREITVWQPLEVTTSPDTEICLGESVPLMASVDVDTTGLTIFWEGGSNLSCINCYETTASPLATTTYTFVAIDLQGCRSEGTTTINVLPIPVPVVEISADTSICFGNIVQLIGAGGNTVSDYQWDTSRLGLNCYENCNNPVAGPTETTTYVLTVFNELGCSSSDSVKVEVLGEAMEFAGPDRIICQGESIQFNITFGDNPEWAAIGGLSCVLCPDPIVSPDTTTIYEVTIDTPDGCILKDFVKVEVIQTLEVDAGPDQINCQGAAITLNGTGNGTVQWSPIGLVENPNNLMSQASASETTVFYLTVDQGDCSLTDSLTVFIEDKTNIEGASYEICEGDSIAIEVTGNADQYLWSGSNFLSEKDIESPTVNPKETTTYTIIASQATCDPDTAEVIVNVLPAPEMDFYDQYDIFPGQALNINLGLMDTIGTFDITWSPESLFTCVDCHRTTILVDSNAQIQLDIFDIQSACNFTFNSTVQFLEGCSEDLIKAPSAFSPNEDGNNDVFQLYPSPSIRQIYSLMIFNRWGGVVFQTNNINQSWDGKYNGEYLPSGIYVYLVEADCPIDGNRFRTSGDLLLVR